MKTKPFTHKLRSTIVAFATISSMLMPMTVGAAGNSVESVTSHEVTGGGTESVTVNATIASRFSVRLPKTITLDGSKKSASYKVTCEGDFPGNQKVVAVPDAAVTLSSVDKADVVAPISQDKTEWLYNETNVEGNGSVNAAGITAGDWNGVFNFNISLDDADVSGHVHAYSEEITKQPTCTEDGEKTLTCECGDTKTAVIPATGHNYVDGVCGECGAVSPDHTHSYAEEVTKAATCTEAGEKTLTCACGDVKTEIIPTTGHNMQNNFCTECGAANEDVFSAPGLYSYNTGELRTSWIDIAKSGYDIEASGEAAFDDVVINPYSEEYVLVLPNGGTKIGTKKFRTTKKLKGIIIPESFTTIEDDAFTGANLEFVNMKNVTHIGHRAFQDNGSLKKVTGLENAEWIGKSAFSSCPLAFGSEGLKLPNLKVMYKYALWNIRKTDIFLGPELQLDTYGTGDVVYFSSGTVHYYRNNLNNVAILAAPWGANEAVMDDWMNLYKDENGAHVHDYREIVTKAATCLQTGEKMTICNGCADRTSESLPKLPHTPNSAEDTCTKCGKQIVKIGDKWYLR